MALPTMTEQQRAEYMRLSIATLDTLKATELARTAPVFSPERLDRVVSIYRASKAVA